MLDSNELVIRTPRSTLGSLMAFETMVLPQLVRLIFVLGLLVCLVQGIGLFMWASEAAGSNIKAGEWALFLPAVLSLTVAPIVLRIGCELAIVVFRIHEGIVELNKSSGPPS